MVRNVVMVELTEEADPEAIAALQEKFRALDCPGTLSYTVGSDLGLRDGTWSFAIVADFVDVDAYRGYDADAQHNRLRAELAPWAQRIARVQFEVPTP
ncbi:MAG: Dabb family protein [Solirubrobacterales bacterium]|nr:Dabb family protein [Solirubrobacterales bacterium]